MNRARQDSITTEIMEIVGGAEALRRARARTTTPTTPSTSTRPPEFRTPREHARHDCHRRTGDRSSRTGAVVAIYGPVVDVEFPPDALPEINHALEMDIELEGETIIVTAEVAQQIGEGRVPRRLPQAHRRSDARRGRAQHSATASPCRSVTARSATCGT